MNRAVVVLLLLIANAVVANWNSKPPHPAPPAHSDYSLGLFSTVDGAPRPLEPYCTASRARDDAPDPLFDVRL
ncbi:MAG: hypothetical protein ACJ8HQ_09945 [Chthoniobacterales bacterium]